MTKKSIAVIMTVYNRKDKTLKCLYSLFKQKNLDDHIIDIYLTDDGSTDGTSDAIKIHFPTVNIIQGNGSLFWTKGMWTAWKVAESKKEYDYICWLNDDVVLFEAALKHILDCSEEKDDKAIISGIMCDPDDHSKTTYSGRFNKKLIIENGNMQEIEYLHGNFVLIPLFVYKNIGIIDNYYSHSGGDTDYSMTAIKKGIKVFSSRKKCGKCRKDLLKPKCFLKVTPLFRRFKILYTPLSYSMPKDIFYFDCKHRNIIVAVLHFISLHFKCLFPKF